MRLISPLQERLNQLWVEAKRDLEEVREDARKKESEKEELAEAQAVEIKVSVTACTGCACIF